MSGWNGFPERFAMSMGSSASKTRLSSQAINACE